MTARTKVAVEAGAVEQKLLVDKPWSALVREVMRVLTPGVRQGLAKGRGRQGNRCFTGRRIRLLPLWVRDKFVDSARLLRGGWPVDCLLSFTSKDSCLFRFF